MQDNIDSTIQEHTSIQREPKTIVTAIILPIHNQFS